MGVWLSFLAVIGFIGYLLVAEQQQPQYGTQTSYDAQNGPAYFSAAQNQPSSQDKANGINKEYIFRTNKERDYWDYALIISTFALVIIGYLTAKAASNSAKAASSSARVANLSLKADRPYLVISDQELINFHAPPLTDDDPKIRFTLINGGKGPAIIKTARATVILSDELPIVGDFSACADMKVKSVIAAGESITKIFDDIILAQYSRENFYSRIISKSQPLIFLGEIVWEDVFRDSYRRTFLYRFNARQNLTYWSADLESSAESVGDFIEGPREYNTYTGPSEPTPDPS